MNACQHKRSGMTLIEVLAAALIVFVLAVLLIVADGRYREEHALAQCKSNLRQIGLATNFYIGDQRAILPAWWGARSEFHGWTMSDIDSNNRPIWQGIGLLVSGGYISRDRTVISCLGPSLRRFRQAAAPYDRLFAHDADEPFFTTKIYRLKRNFTDGDGVMDLGSEWNVPSGKDVLVSNYWMRFLDAPHGTMYYNRAFNEYGHSFAAVSDSILGWAPLPGIERAPTEPTFISNHDGVWNVLFMDGSVKTYQDTDGALKRRLGEISQMGREDYESALGRSRLIFEEFFDPLHEE